jgi:hypothetical protein
VSGAPDPPVALSTLREAIRRAVAASSLRAVADEVGVSHTVIVKLLAGSKPHPTTMRKLLRWYVRQGGVLDEDTALASIALLIDTTPVAERECARAELIQVLRSAHRRAGSEPPDWLK